MLARRAGAHLVARAVSCHPDVVEGVLRHRPRAPWRQQHVRPAGHLLQQQMRQRGVRSDDAGRQLTRWPEPGLMSTIG